MNILDHRMRCPRIMHVVLSLGEGGGAERLVYDMARSDIFIEKLPVICCLINVGSLGKKLEIDGYHVYCWSNKKSGIDFGIFRWMSRIMKEEKIEVVHAHQYTPLIYAALAAKLVGKVKVVYTEHGRLFPEQFRWKRYFFDPFIALGVDHFVSISESTKNAMVRYDNFPKKKIKVVHNGVNHLLYKVKFDSVAKRRSLGLNEKCRIVGTAARLESIKNIPMMLQAFRIVSEQHSDTFLLIAGRGSEEKNLKTLVKELEIEDKVMFIGLREDLPEIYQLMEVFLLTSFSEGISVTLLESMASGITSVVSNVGGNREVVVDGETGFLVKLGDYNKMAEVINQLLDDSELTRKLGENAQIRVIREFSFDNMLKRYIYLYNK